MNGFNNGQSNGFQNNGGNNLPQYNPGPILVPQSSNPQEAAQMVAQGKFPYLNEVTMTGQVFPFNQNDQLGFRWVPGKDGKDGKLEVNVKLRREWGGRNPGVKQSKVRMVAYGNLGQQIGGMLNQAGPGAIIHFKGELNVSNFKAQSGNNAGQWITTVNIQVKEGRNNETPFVILGRLPVQDESRQQQGNFGNWNNGGNGGGQQNFNGGGNWGGGGQQQNNNGGGGAWNNGGGQPQGNGGGNWNNNQQNTAPQQQNFNGGGFQGNQQQAPQQQPAQQNFNAPPNNGGQQQMPQGNFGTAGGTPAGTFAPPTGAPQMPPPQGQPNLQPQGNGGFPAQNNGGGGGFAGFGGDVPFKEADIPF